MLRVAIDGPYLRARESVGMIFGGMLRKLAGFGVIYDTDPQRISSYQVDNLLATHHSLYYTTRYVLLRPYYF